MRSRGTLSLRSSGLGTLPPKTQRCIRVRPGSILALLTLGLLGSQVATAQTTSSSVVPQGPEVVCNLVDDAMLGPDRDAEPRPELSGLATASLLNGEVLEIPGIFVGPPMPPYDFEPFPRPSVMPPMSFSKSLGIPKTPFGKQIYKVASRHALNPQLVAAVIQMESAFNPRARSSKGAFGLMQLLPATARRFGVKRREILNPLKNLEAGTRYLKWLAERFEGDTLLVLAAYNAGEGSVERFGGVPPFRETRDYVQRILSRLGTNLFGTAPPPSAEATRVAK